MDASTATFESLDRQLADLTNLDDGWFDDESLGPTTNAVQSATDVARVLEAEALPPPTAFPTPEGGVSLEWIEQDAQVGVTVLATGSQGELSYWNHKTGVDGFEHTDDLSAELVAQYVRHQERTK